MRHWINVKFTKHYSPKYTNLCFRVLPRLVLLMISTSAATPSLAQEDCNHDYEPHTIYNYTLNGGTHFMKQSAMGDYFTFPSSKHIKCPTSYTTLWPSGFIKEADAYCASMPCSCWRSDCSCTLTCGSKSLTASANIYGYFYGELTIDSCEPGQQVTCSITNSDYVNTQHQPCPDGRPIDSTCSGSSQCWSMVVPPNADAYNPLNCKPWIGSSSSSEAASSSSPYSPAPTSASGSDSLSSSDDQPVRDSSSGPFSSSSGKKHCNVGACPEPPTTISYNTNNAGTTQFPTAAIVAPVVVGATAVVLFLMHKHGVLCFSNHKGVEPSVEMGQHVGPPPPYSQGMNNPIGPPPPY